MDAGNFMRPGRRWLLLCALLGAWGSEVQAARVRQVALADMVARAGRVFVGRCVGRTAGIDDGTHLPVTTYTFAVTEPIKGVAGGQTAFTMPGTHDRPLIAGLPAFDPGEEVLLLLYPESAAGFSTPIGLDQGRFRIASGHQGRREAVNGTGNDRLLEDVPASLLQEHALPAGAHGPLDLDRLVAIIEELSSRARP